MKYAPTSLLLYALLGACSHVLPAVPGTVAKLPHVPSGVQVGTARADLTLPPGVATWGHGPDSRIANGTWGRNYCRVFYFETDHGQKLALIPCELPAMSLLLQREVASRLNVPLHATQIMMTAIHTHAGPGHYFGASQYTGALSTRNPGYDVEVVKELSARIALAIDHAVANRRAAKLSWAHRDDFWCFSRNRSIQAYRLNVGGAEGTRFQPAVPNPWPADQPCDAPTRDDYRAIDPALDVLRIDTLTANPADSEPIGSLSFFAMHPTVIRNGNQYLGGDATGVVNRFVERQMRREWMARHPQCSAYWAQNSCTGTPPADCSPPDPLHGVVNTNEGDMAARWTRGDVEEAVSIGEALGAFVWSRHPDPSSAQSQVIIDSRYVEESIRGATYHDAQGQAQTTCDFPQVGQGAARGGSDHPTSVASIPAFGADPVVDYGSTECHAPKRPLLGRLSRSSRSEGAFPSTLPLAVSRIGDTLIAFVPAELTITAGHRVKERVRAAIASHAGSPQRVVVAGLSNEYIQYVATREEYQLQNYEGASTLYGPGSNGYFANRMALLSRSLFDPGVDAQLPLLGKAGKVPVGFGPERDRLAEPESTVLPKPGGLCTMPGTEPAPRICYYWRDGGPGAVALSTAPWIRLVKPLGSCSVPALQCWAGGAHCDAADGIDDVGHHFRTQIHEEVDHRFVWSTLFDPGDELWSGLGNTSVAIEVGGTLQSAPFSRAALPTRCTVQQTRLCLEGHRTEEWDGLLP